MEQSHSTMEAVWTSVDKLGVRWIPLTQLQKLPKSLPLFVKNPRLLNNHCMIGIQEIEPRTADHGGGNKDGPPGGIVEITHDFAVNVGGIFRDHANDLDTMLEMVMNLP
jgi:hypothetical protein